MQQQRQARVLIQQQRSNQHNSEIEKIETKFTNQCQQYKQIFDSLRGSLNQEERAADQQLQKEPLLMMLEQMVVQVQTWSQHHARALEKISTALTAKLTAHHQQHSLQIEHTQQQCRKALLQLVDLCENACLFACKQTAVGRVDHLAHKWTADNLQAAIDSYFKQARLLEEIQIKQRQDRSNNFRWLPHFHLYSESDQFIGKLDQIAPDIELEYGQLLEPEQRQKADKYLYTDFSWFDTVNRSHEEKCLVSDVERLISLSGVQFPYQLEIQGLHKEIQEQHRQIVALIADKEKLEQSLLSSEVRNRALLHVIDEANNQIAALRGQCDELRSQIPPEIDQREAGVQTLISGPIGPQNIEQRANLSARKGSLNSAKGKSTQKH